MTTTKCDVKFVIRSAVRMCIDRSCNQFTPLGEILGRRKIMKWPIELEICLQIFNSLLVTYKKIQKTVYIKLTVDSFVLELFIMVLLAFKQGHEIRFYCLFNINIINTLYVICHMWQVHVIYMFTSVCCDQILACELLNGKIVQSVSHNAIT